MQAGSREAKLILFFAGSMLYGGRRVAVANYYSRTARSFFWIFFWLLYAKCRQQGWSFNQLRLLHGSRSIHAGIVE